MIYYTLGWELTSGKYHYFQRVTKLSEIPSETAVELTPDITQASVWENASDAIEAQSGFLGTYSVPSILCITQNDSERELAFKLLNQAIESRIKFNTKNTVKKTKGFKSN